ncbi:ef hand family protein [Phytophthora cinnamomi]|uniref:ef hand family protein n=1 Tax=Phytophthora cinnamomi TaxID=4785 RepID=UPI0035593F4D|nr:ef hand family protein [Phytophthora cinnamomi]
MGDEEASDGDKRITPAFLTEVANQFSKQRASGRPYEHDPEKGFTMDIMMMMDMEKVSTLRNEFLRKEKGLSIAEFVYVMMRFVQSSAHTDENSRLHDLSESQLVANLCELFAQIDINGDGSMEWEEFTSFIVDTGLTVKSHQPNSIQQYHHVQWEDASKHSTFIDHIYYFPSNDLVALVESCSPYFKLYNVNCELTRTIKSPEGFVQCAEHLPKYNQYIVASSDLQFRFYDDTTLRLMKSCHTPTSQNCLKWYPESSALFSAGLILRLHGHNNSLCGVEIIPDTPQIITADVDGVFKVWDIRNFACMQTFTAENMGDVKNIVSITSEKRIVAAGKKLIKFDYEKLENPELTDDHPVFIALYNPTSLSFITAAGRDVKIWDARVGKLIRVYRNLSSTDLTTLCLDFRERKFIIGDHGDDKGFLSVWNVLPLLMRLANNFDLKPLARPVECANAQRNLRVDAASMVRKARNTPEWAAYAHRDPLSSFFFSVGMPLVATGVDDDEETRCEDGEMRRLPPVSLVHRWKAHGDVVYSVQTIEEPKSLVTSSFDRRVKIWSLSGECLGVLMQGGLDPSSGSSLTPITGHPDVAKHRPWRFSVDYDARERRKETAAAPVVEDVHILLRQDERRDLIAERRRTERIAQAAAAEASVMEEISRTYLPPLLPRRAGAAATVAAASAATDSISASSLGADAAFVALQPLRKTPRRKPVNAATAGRSAVVPSPRLLRLRGGGSSNNSRLPSPRAPS